MTVELDNEGFLVDLSQWSESIARDLAKNEDIELTEEHWLVLHALREFYQQTDVSPAMRPFVKLVKTSCGEERGNSIHLMTLFGSSPAKVAAKIAGLPRPTNCL